MKIEFGVIALGLSLTACDGGQAAKEPCPPPPKCPECPKLAETPAPPSAPAPAAALTSAPPLPPAASMGRAIPSAGAHSTPTTAQAARETFWFQAVDDGKYELVGRGCVARDTATKREKHVFLWYAKLYPETRTLLTFPGAVGSIPYGARRFAAPVYVSSDPPSNPDAMTNKCTWTGIDAGGGYAELVWSEINANHGAVDVLIPDENATTVAAACPAESVAPQELDNGTSVIIENGALNAFAAVRPIPGYQGFTEEWTFVKGANYSTGLGAGLWSTRMADEILFLGHGTTGPVKQDDVRKELTSTLKKAGAATLRFASTNVYSEPFTYCRLQN